MEYLILKAQIRRVTGNATHSLGTLFDGVPVAVSPLPTPAWVGIAHHDVGVFRIRFDEEGSAITDTWHASVEDAKGQAEFAYEISESDWHATDEPFDR